MTNSAAPHQLAFRSQVTWIYTICKGRAYHGSAGLGLRGIVTLSKEITLSKLFKLPAEKGSKVKGKNLFPTASISFLLKLTPFQKGTGVQLKQRESEKLFPLSKSAENFSSVSIYI